MCDTVSASDKQVCALKYLIINARVGDLAKRIARLLLVESFYKGDVCLTLSEDSGEYTREEIDRAATDFHRMLSSNSTTHLNELAQLMGTERMFTYHYGDYDRARDEKPLNTDGMFAGAPDRLLNAYTEEERRNIAKRGMPMRYTFWFATDLYSHTSERIPADREFIDGISLTDSGLYPELRR